MIRICIHCKHIYGCHGHNGIKWNCNSCRKRASCTKRIMLKPPIEEITGGICDWCFKDLVIRKHNKILSSGVNRLPKPPVT